MNTILVIFSILTISLAIAVAVLVDKLTVAKRGLKFHQEVRHADRITTAKILNRLVTHGAWLKYMAERAEKREDSKQEFKILTDIIEHLWRTLYFCDEEELLTTMEGTRDFLVQFFPQETLPMPDYSIPPNC